MLTERLLAFSLGGAEWVLYLLLGLSFLSIAMMVERAIAYALFTGDPDHLAEELNRSLEAGDPAAALETAHATRGVAARVAESGLRALHRGPGAVEQVMAGTLTRQRLRLERGLVFLGTLGNNAPFLGLFGTVLGIIKAFRDLSTETAQGASAVMAGISEALVATAVGLFVALPAVVAFNVFQRRLKNIASKADAVSRTVLAFAKSTDSPEPVVTAVD